MARLPDTEPGNLNAWGFVPEDFHLIRTGTATYETPGWPNWQNEWEVLNRNPFGADIAQENPNDSFGWSEGDDIAKWSGVRHPNHPERYMDTDLQLATNFEGGAVYTFANKEPFDDVGYGAGNTGAGNARFDWDDSLVANGQHDAGESSEPFQDLGLYPGSLNHQTTAFGAGDGVYNMGNIISEDVNGLLMRAVRWFVDHSFADGFRLDAVKHVPSYFFGKDSGADKDFVNWGYGGAIQEQFNISHGFNDWENHRNSCFDDFNNRNDAMLFGEHLGDPPNKFGYLNAGMRVANDDLLNSVKGNIGANFWGLDATSYGLGGLGVHQAMLYVMSHDNNYIWGGDRPQAHAYILSREGLPIVYTDGYNQAGPPDWFPKPSEIPFLGQFSQPYLPNMLFINEHFVRGAHFGRWSDGEYCAYLRSQSGDVNDVNSMTLLFMMARNYTSAQTRDFNSGFPVGARLKNYSYHGGSFYAVVQGDGSLRDTSGGQIYVPSGGYFAFSWTLPEMPAVWDDGMFGDVQPITIYQNGQQVGTVSYERKDGRDGDADFNPYGVPGDTPGDYVYTHTVPRITVGTNLTILGRSDGSAGNMKLKLDGGGDVNSHLGLGPLSGELRDEPPGVDDRVLGYEQMQYVQRLAEKFAATNVGNNVIGSYGAETFVATIGSAGFSQNVGNGPNTGNGTPSWVYHNPIHANEGSPAAQQFSPAPDQAAGSNVLLSVKAGYSGEVHRAWVYYTTNGTDYPEGSHGEGKGNTQVAEMSFSHYAPPDPQVAEWWTVNLPAQSSGTELRYKIGLTKNDAPSLFPWSEQDILVKARMETLFQIPGLNAETLTYYPHNDYGVKRQGLVEGFHSLRLKSILGRDSAHSEIYRISKQTVYYDAQRPEGEILDPVSDGVTLNGSMYTFLARSDETVVDTWFRITDGDPSNDDSVTSAANGNGAWAKATQATHPSPGLVSDYVKEWNFDYVNIPSSGSATCEVRFVEISSSSDMNLADDAGHYTTLSRSVHTGGSGLFLYIVDPSSDLDMLSAGDGVQANFSQDLTNGFTEAELISQFDVSLDGVLQTSLVYAIQYNVTANDHALTFTLPNLYNGIPSFQHVIDVLFTNTPNLTAQRLVLAEPDSDSDNDEIPDFWEDLMGLDKDDPDDADDDDDLDGRTSLEEFKANTHPFDINDRLEIDNLTPMVPDMRFSVDGKSNRVYYVWYNDTGLVDDSAWTRATPLSSPLEGEDQLLYYIDDGSQTGMAPTLTTSRFYRIEVDIAN